MRFMPSQRNGISEDWLDRCKPDLSAVGDVTAEDRVSKRVPKVLDKPKGKPLHTGMLARLFRDDLQEAEKEEIEVGSLNGEAVSDSETRMDIDENPEARIGPEAGNGNEILDFGAAMEVTKDCETGTRLDDLGDDLSSVEDELESPKPNMVKTRPLETVSKSERSEARSVSLSNSL